MNMKKSCVSLYEKPIKLTFNVSLAPFYRAQVVCSKFHHSDECTNNSEWKLKYSIDCREVICHMTEL